MPAVHSWITEALSEIAEVKSTDDHAVIGWLCLPTAGVIGAQKWDFFVTFVCNFLGQHPKNGMVLIVHSNRASQIKGSPKDIKEKIERSWAKRMSRVNNDFFNDKHLRGVIVQMILMAIIALSCFNMISQFLDPCRYCRFCTRPCLFLFLLNSHSRRDVKDEMSKSEVKEDDDSSGESDDGGERDAEEAEVRDVKHMLERPGLR